MEAAGLVGRWLGFVLVGATVAACPTAYGAAQSSSGTGDDVDGADANDGSVPDDGGGNAVVGPHSRPCPDASPDPALVGWYPLDEGAGTVSHDCAGGHDGLIIDAADSGMWTMGRSGTALRFDGAHGCIEIGAAPTHRLTPSGFTVAAWIRVASFDSDQNYVIGKTRDPNIAGWRLGVELPSEAQMKLALGDGGFAQVEATGVPAYVWTHVAAVFVPGARAELFLNGLRAASIASPAAIVEDELAAIRIGCRSDDRFHFNGEIDDVRIYSRGLSGEEISAIARAP